MLSENGAGRASVGEPVALGAEPWGNCEDECGEGEAGAGSNAGKRVSARARARQRSATRLLCFLNPACRVTQNTQPEPAETRRTRH